METQHFSSTNEHEIEQDALDIKALAYKILRSWYWIVLCLVIAYIGARLYLRYTVPIYETSSKVLIKVQQGGRSGGLSEEVLLEEFGVSQLVDNLDNEIHILRSRSLMKEVVRKLDANISYISLGRIKEREQYRKTPILVDSIRWGGRKQFISFDEDRN